jgi:hypothetical protein
MKRPGGVWGFYTGLAIGLIIVQMLFLWFEADGLQTDLVPIIVFNSFFTPFLPALIYHLDRQAMSAMVTLSPGLELDGSELRLWKYRLTNMPAIGTLLVGIGMTVFVITMENVSAVPIRYSALKQLPTFSVVFHIIDKSSAFLFGVVIYHTLRQLRLVSKLNSDYIRIDLLNLGPWRAFSNLTASTAVGLLVGVYTFLIINPDLLEDPLGYGFLLLMTFLAVMVFVWPLYGIHRRMRSAKEKELHAINLRFQALFLRFNDLLEKDDIPGVEQLTGPISSLEIQYKKIEAIPTWPWRPEAIRSVVTAIALPVLLMVIQLFVERVLRS